MFTKRKIKADIFFIQVDVAMTVHANNFVTNSTTACSNVIVKQDFRYTKTAIVAQVCISILLNNLVQT